MTDRLASPGSPMHPCAGARSQHWSSALAARLSAAMTAGDRTWLRDAACTVHDPELFFPIGSSGPAANQTDRARQVCATCPVQISCLDWALQVGADYGVWGGLSEEDRQVLRRRRRRHGSPAAQPTNPSAANSVGAEPQQRTTRAADSLLRRKVRT